MAAIILLSVAPFVLVELFKSQLYRVMEVSSYLVFHNVVEIFSVMVSLSIFGLGWFSFDQNKDSHALYLSAAFLAIGLMDFMHALAYTGMPPLVTLNTPNKSTQFWIVVRLFSASVFLSSAFIYPQTVRCWLSKTYLIAIALSICFIVFAAIIFFPEHVPATFVQGKGLTFFKMTSEYVIMIMMSIAIVFYWRRMSRTGEKLIVNYLAAFVLCIFSEFVLSNYKSVFDTYNILGHLYKLVAFMLIYNGIFIVSVRKPYEYLRRNRNMLSHIMNSIPQAIYWKDREGVYLGCNSVFAKQAGFDNPDDIVGQYDRCFHLNKDECEKNRSDEQDVMASNTAKCHELEIRRRADGTANWLDTTKIPLIDSSGNVEGILGVYEDITARKNAEDELKEALLFNKQVITCAREGIVVYDRGLRYLVWNPFMEEVSGLQAAELIGKKYWEAFPFFDESGIPESLQRVLQGESVETSEFKYHVSEPERTGWVSLSYAPLLNVRKEIIGIIGTLRDITERKKTEEQRRHSQKMEALGQLAGGVAHDFNNMLQVIIGYAWLLEKSASTAQKERIKDILSACERAAELTSGLLSYSSKQVFRIEPIELDDLIGGVENFLRRILGEDISFSFVRSPISLVASIDRAHMQQVFVNLASNARHAMASGGMLSISLEKVDMNEAFVQAHGFGKIGSYGLITVSDNGSGIPKEHLHRIYEPFFTTKENGKGTGLGLSIVYGIVTQHNGFIKCYSEEGVGTTFRIYLPLTATSEKPLEVEDSIAADAYTNLTVLIAEDDPAVRRITRHILEMHGHSVIESANGSEAVTRYRENSGKIDLLILDALMPELNGADALSRIREFKPDAKALFVSGYAREILSGRMLLPDDADLIIKPVLPEKLLDAIRRTMDRGR